MPQSYALLAIIIVYDKYVYFVTCDKFFCLF